MPSTLWSAPAQYGNTQPFVNSTLSVATLDMSPGEYVIPAGVLNLGTRVRIIAWGSYISASSTTTGLAFSFVMNAPGTATPLATTPAVLTTGPVVTVVASTMPWMLEYWGVITATSVNANTTTGQIVGRGRQSIPLTSWVTAPAEFIAPQTVGAQTVQQTATAMNTSVPQQLFAAVALSTTATGMTSITTNELTCEIIG